MKIVLADENIDRRFKLKLMLRKFDCTFYEARNADVAFDAIKSEQPDICLIDYMIPGSAGLSNYDICRRISDEYSMPAVVLLREGVTVERKFPGIEYAGFPETEEEKANLIEKIEKLTGRKLEPKPSGSEIRTRTKLVKVMIADDEESVRMLIKTLLRQYEISEASTGVELMEKAPEFNPDLIVTDVIMPGVSGWKAVRELRKNKNLKDVPVVFASGYVKDKEIYEMHRPAGPTEFVLKPFRKKELFDVLEKYFILEN